MWFNYKNPCIESYIRDPINRAIKVTKDNAILEIGSFNTYFGSLLSSWVLRFTLQSFRRNENGSDQLLHCVGEHIPGFSSGALIPGCCSSPESFFVIFIMICMCVYTDR